MTPEQLAKRLRDNPELGIVLSVTAIDGEANRQLRQEHKKAQERSLKDAVQAVIDEVCKLRDIAQPELEYYFHPTRRWRFDRCWPEMMLAIEIDGGTWRQGRHNRAQGYEGDCEKLNAALWLGWRVLRYTSGMVYDGRMREDILTGIPPDWRA